MPWHAVPMIHIGDSSEEDNIIVVRGEASERVEITKATGPQNLSLGDEILHREAKFLACGDKDPHWRQQ
jgi:hypothetical protein